MARWIVLETRGRGDKIDGRRARESFVLVSITLGAARPLAAAPAFAQDPQKMGVPDAARESLFGDGYAQPFELAPALRGRGRARAHAGRIAALRAAVA